MSQDIPPSGGYFSKANLLTRAVGEEDKKEKEKVRVAFQLLLFLKCKVLYFVAVFVTDMQHLPSIFEIMGLILSTTKNKHILESHILNSINRKYR
jgi:hypothetical protein